MPPVREIAMTARRVFRAFMFMSFPPFVPAAPGLVCLVDQLSPGSLPAPRGPRRGLGRPWVWSRSPRRVGSGRRLLGVMAQVRLRQAVLCARDLEGTVERLRTELALGEPYRDPEVGYFGLENAVFAIG